MSFDRYLSDEQLRDVMKALIEANLFSMGQQDAMRAAIRPSYQGLLPTNAVPNTQLLLTLRQLNRVHNLVNGDVPIAQFLESATILATGTQAAQVIERALETIRYSDPLPPLTPVIATRTTVDTGSSAAPAVIVVNTDVELQAQTGALDQTVSVRFLREGSTASASVVKLLVHRHMDGHGEFLDGDRPRLVNGTGWIIAPRLLITNHHVINARRKEGVIEPDATEQDFRMQAEQTQVLFDYVNSNSVPAPVVTGAGALLYSDKDLDFALLRLPLDAPARLPLRLRTHAIRKTERQALGIGVNLLQHPNGDPMRLGFRNNYVVLGNDDWLSYLTDTSFGSSGSPVCDDSWVVAALHRGSRAIEGPGFNILGQQYRRQNYGTPITSIMANLQAKAPALKDEIAAGQVALV